MKWPGRKPPYILGMLLVFAFLLVGTGGLVLPVIPGLLLIILGLLLFLEYHDVPWLAKKRDVLIKKYREWKQRR